MPPNKPPKSLYLAITADCPSAQKGNFFVEQLSEGVKNDRTRLVSQITPTQWETLRWYAEEAFKGEAGSAERARAATKLLQEIGQEYYKQLFDHGAPHDWLIEALKDKSGRLVIVSNEPCVHAEPWELLRAPDGGPLFDRGIRIVRKLSKDPPPGSSSGHLVVPLTKLRILLVKPRPTGYPLGSSFDISQALSGAPGIEIKECNRPTLQRLESMLREARYNGDPITVVHFDGHGIYDEKTGEGALLFEREDGSVDTVGDDRLRIAFSEVPVVVLEACRTASTDGPRWDAVAPQLLRHGVAAIIAMRYSAHVDMVRTFMSAFYDAIVRGRTIAESVDEARRHVLITNLRRPSRESADQESVGIYDWWVPQLFQGARDTALFVREEPVEVQDEVARPNPSSRRSRRWRLWVSIAIAVLIIGGYTFNLHRPQLMPSVKNRAAVLKLCDGGNQNQCLHALSQQEICCQENQSGAVNCCYQAGVIADHKLYPPQWARASSRYERACEAPTPEPLACANLAMLLEEGKGVPKDPVRAFHFYEKACNLNHTSACNNVGLIYANCNNEAKVACNQSTSSVYFKKSCANGEGEPRGCANYGNAILKLNEEDLAEAYRMFRLACERGDHLGCVRMGDFENNPYEKARLYEKSCLPNGEDAIQCTACLLLARTYSKPEFGKAENLKSIELNMKLCEHDCSDGDSAGQACRELCKFYQSKETEGAEQRENLRLAEKWCEKGCERRDSQSCFFRGMMFKKRLSFNALEYFKPACKYGSPEGCCMAIKISRLKTEPELSERLGERACELGAACCEKPSETAQSAP